MTRTRRALLLLGLSAVLGGLASADVARREAALASRLAPLVEVVVAAEDLDARRRLRLEDMAVQTVPERYAPIGAATAPVELVGRRLAVPVPRGGTVGVSQLSEPLTAGAPVGRGERAVELVGLGSPQLVVPGVRVDVLITRESEPGVPAATELALEDVEVLDARRAGADAAAGGAGVPRVAATLRVGVRDAVYLTAAQAFAREVRLLPRASGDGRRVGRLAVGERLR